MKRINNKILGIISIFLFFFNFFVWKEIFGMNSNLKVVFLDIGQGDSIFIETSQKHQILIDGGPSANRLLEKIGKRMPFWDRTIDLIVLTHTDYDHLNGLLGVLERYKVENVLWTGIGQKSDALKRWDIDLKKEKARVILATDKVSLIAGQARLDVLYPFLNQEDLPTKQNDLSVVSKLSFGSNSFLFPGDINSSIEKKLLLLDIQADVVKISHHGSKYASSKEFLSQSNPKVGVISSGKDNQYKHPHPETLRTLEKFGIKVMRTDELGDIEIRADGENLFLVK